MAGTTSATLVRSPPIRLSPDVAARADVELRRAVHARHAIDVGDERESAGLPVPAPADPPGDDRAQPIGADREPCPHGAAAALVVAGDDAGHGAAIVEQLVHGGALRHFGAGPPRRVQERVVQDAARYGEPRRPGRRWPGEREPAVQAAAPSRGHHRAVKRGARRLERGHHAEPLEQPDRFGAHVLRAGLVAGEGGAIHDAARGIPFRRTARRSRSRRARHRRRGRRRPRRRQDCRWYSKPSSTSRSGDRPANENSMTSVPPPAKAIWSWVPVMVQVHARSVVRGNPSASDSVTRVWRQLPSASNCQVVVQVWTSPGDLHHDHGLPHAYDRRRLAAAAAGPRAEVAAGADRIRSGGFVAAGRRGEDQ